MSQCPIALVIVIDDTIVFRSTGMFDSLAELNRGFWNLYLTQSNFLINTACKAYDVYYTTKSYFDKNRICSFLFPIEFETSILQQNFLKTLFFIDKKNYISYNKGNQTTLLWMTKAILGIIPECFPIYVNKKYFFRF